MTRAEQIREAKQQAENWTRYSRTATCVRKHEFLHALVMAACWRAKAKKLAKQKGKTKCITAKKSLSALTT